MCVRTERKALCIIFHNECFCILILLFFFLFRFYLIFSQQILHIRIFFFACLIFKINTAKWPQHSIRILFTMIMTWLMGSFSSKKKLLNGMYKSVFFVSLNLPMVTFMSNKVAYIQFEYGHYRHKDKIRVASVV